MRLTHYDEHKKRWQINDDYGAVMIDELNYAVGEAIDKLAAYEDMELTPEEFHESVAFVLELNKKLKPYMDADEQGRLVRLPFDMKGIKLVVTERERQIDLWGDQSGNHPFEWISILGEEYGELCEAVNETCFRNQKHPERGGKDNIVKEAVHVAAVAVAIAEAALKGEGGDV